MGGYPSAVASQDTTVYCEGLDALAPTLDQISSCRGSCAPNGLVPIAFPLVCGNSRTEPAHPVLHTLALCFSFPRISAPSFPPACLPCPHPCPHRGRHQQLAGGREGGVLFPSRSSQFLAPKCCQENRQLPLSVMCSTNKADFSQHCHFSCKALSDLPP